LLTLTTPIPSPIIVPIAHPTLIPALSTKPSLTTSVSPSSMTSMKSSTTWPRTISLNLIQQTNFHTPNPLLPTCNLQPATLNHHGLKTQDSRLPTPLPTFNLQLSTFNNVRTCNQMAPPSKPSSSNTPGLIAASSSANEQASLPWLSTSQWKTNHSL